MSFKTQFYLESEVVLAIISKKGHLAKLFLGVIDALRYSEPKRVGRPYLYTTQVIVKLFLVMVYYRLSSVRSLERFVCLNPELAQSCGLNYHVPSYRTLTRRFKRLDEPVLVLVKRILVKLVSKRIIRLAILATDGSLLKAKGKEQPKKRPDIIPADKEAKWGYSLTRGWVWGYKLHLISTVKPCIVPLSWLITTANFQESPEFIGLAKTAVELAKSKLKKIKAFLGDSAYEGKEIYQWSKKEQKIAFICPIKDGKVKHPRAKERKMRLKLFKTKRIKRLFKRRADIERLFSQLKELFLIDPLPVIGLRKVSTYVNLTCLAYLAAVYYNYSNGRGLRQIKSIVA